VIVASIQGRRYLLMSHHISHLNMKCDCGGTKEGLRKKGIFVGISGRGGTQSEIRKRVSPIKSVRVARSRRSGCSMKGTKGIQMGSERHRDHQGQDEGECERECDCGGRRRRVLKMLMLDARAEISGWKYT
jgi:hypothetical protein